MTKQISDEDFMRFEKHFLLPEIGFLGQEKIKNAKVMVIGAGGLGCPSLQYLCANGIGTLGLIDHDQVEIHNLHRQILYGLSDIGKPKVEVAQQKLLQLFPGTEIHAIREKAVAENIHNILAPYDIVVDGSDNFATRYLVNDACVELGKPLVYGSILKFEGQLAVFNFKGSKNLRHIFPEPPNPEDVPSCAENGVLGTLPGIVGLLMAQETLKIILDLPVLHNEWVIYKTLEHRFLKLGF